MNEHIVVVVRSHADDVTVFALQCRASEDDARGSGFEGGDRLVAEEDQPVPAVGVGEGDAVCHFLDVGLRVELWEIFVLVRSRGLECAGFKNLRHRLLGRAV